MKDCSRHLTWLLLNTAPWAAVEKHWKECLPLRLHILEKKGKTIYDIFEE